MIPRVLILRAPGINRDGDAAAACELVGATAELVHINRLASDDVRLADFAMLVVPGGFSYGDHLGAGKLLALDLIHRLGEQLAAFVADGRPVLGICNGFQVLVKAGILPGKHDGEAAPHAAEVTLTDNASASFECRWVQLAADPASTCIFTRGMDRPIEVPVAHGEGRLTLDNHAVLGKLQQRGQVALRYVVPEGASASFPHNPNGSVDNIAGICNPAGNVLGLMPHPEDAILPHQHPRWTREAPRAVGDGLLLFQNAIAYAKSL